MAKETQNSLPFEIPVVRATKENLSGYGRFVTNFDEEKVEINPWPVTGPRKARPGTDIIPGVDCSQLTFKYEGNKYVSVKDIGRRMEVGTICEEEQSPDNKYVLVSEITFHPDCGEVFYPKNGDPFITVLALPGDDFGKTEREAIAVLLDVGPSMNQAPPGVATPLETALEAITMILQRKMFAESKDEVALVLVGSEETDNPLADDESYQHISIANPLGVVDFDFLQLVQNDVKPTTTSGDFVDGIVVAMDHLMNALQGKKGFGFKRLIVMSDLGGEFGDDQVDTIIASIKNSGTELNIIGPDFDDDDDAGPTPGTSGEERKEKTPQQRAGHALVRHILEEVDGECYSFSEALPALSYFQSRQVRPTAWKCPLEIGPELKIPINGYVKVKDFKLKQSWKAVYAKDPEMEVGKLRTYHKNDEEETEVDKDDMVEKHRYGTESVTIPEEDKGNMKYKAEKCFKVLGFTKMENVKRSEMMGDGCMAVVAEKGDEAAGIALSALINALYETNMCAIVRRVYNASSSPRVGCLVAHIKADYECLYWFELPFMEDVRQFTFGSLPLKEENPTNKKYKPTEDQLSAVDSLITSMDLSTAAQDEEEESTELLKPKLTFNPHFQRLYQCLQHRALNPDDELPELSPMIANYLKPPEEVVVRSQSNLESLRAKFKLEAVKRKEEKTGENLFKENGDGEPAGKKVKVDGDLEGGMETIAKATVTEVGSTTPVEDFMALISMKDEDKFEEACGQMQKRIQQIVLDSFGDQFYGKAMECVKCLREQCIKKQEPSQYNTFIKSFKETLVSKARKDFLDKMVDGKQSLITSGECEGGAAPAEVEEFQAGEATQKDEAKEEDTAEDLLDEL
ncbi:X-ray repair cross-complementing protein 5-like [Mya arenaria]|uniref:X-ray repair cross-complementing protein 5-like n=1 Tax=Mya arenaria TaxID=6604 RepID=UPI0022E7E20B|nr:X-ray repair cross-complementing protein 5-like [Mya arenaria]